ncbi:hypothetical protein DRH14_04755, partial [Candidatus Shapirobacteria bacterium]
NKTTTRSQKRIGRGYGSKKGGHTTIRGAKGKKARNKVPLTFDGTKIKKGWIKRLPFLKGKGRLKRIKSSRITFNLNDLHKWFKDKSLVDFSSLSKASKIPEATLRRKGVKILSGASRSQTPKITKSFKFKDITLSQSAKKYNETKK